MRFRARWLARVRRTLGRWGLLHPRLRAPALLFTLTLVLFSAQRLLLALIFDERFAAAELEALLWSFIVGLRFDVVVAGMLVVPLMLVLPLAQPALLRRRGFKSVVAGYCGFVIALLTLLLVADVFFFARYSERLNHKVVQYLGDSGNSYILWILLTDYPLVPALLGAGAIGVAGGWCFYRLGFRDRFNDGRVWHGIVYPLIAAMLLFLGIRGTVTSHAINAGPAFFSDVTTVAQLTLNGGFTLRQAIISTVFKGSELSRLYPTLPRDQAFEATRELIVTERDRPVDDPRNPLRRVTDTGRPRRDHNVVLVVLEGLSWHYIEAMGGRKGLTPNLDRLARRGLFMPRCFAVGNRTQRGFAGLVASYPDLPNGSVTTRSQSIDRFITLGTVLQRRDYQTMFIYGGPGVRDHRQSFLGSNGYDRFVTEANLPRKTFSTKLGYCDGDLFFSAHQILTESDDRPFFATLLTLSNHQPFAIPEGKIEPVPADRPHADQLSAIRYTDWAIGRFIEKAKQADYFENTIFVFTADHPGGFAERRKNPVTYRVPFIVYAPGVIGTKSRRITQVCSQMDVAPTIMTLLGGRYEHTFFGTSVLNRPDDEGWALTYTGARELIYYGAGGRGVVLPPHRKQGWLFDLQMPAQLRRLEANTAARRDLRERYQRRAVSVMQAASVLFERGRFNLDGPSRTVATALADGNERVAASSASSGDGDRRSRADSSRRVRPE